MPKTTPFIYFAFLVSMSSFMLIACSQRPAGIPELLPVTVTVMKDGAPLAGANIGLYPTDSAAFTKAPGVLAFTGKTGDDGVATIKTICGKYVGEGVPQGSFRVTVAKLPNVVHSKTEDQRAKMQETEALAYQKEIEKQIQKLGEVVPAKLGDVVKSPLLLEVGDKGGALSVNVDEYMNKK